MNQYTGIYRRAELFLSGPNWNNTACPRWKGRFCSACETAAAGRMSWGAILRLIKGGWQSFYPGWRNAVLSAEV